MTFERGDIVKLKCGGPEMVVQAPDSLCCEIFYCIWFNEGSELQGSNFWGFTLEKVEQTNKIGYK